MTFDPIKELNEAIHYTHDILNNSLELIKFCDLFVMLFCIEIDLYKKYVLCDTFISFIENEFIEYSHRIITIDPSISTYVGQIINSVYNAKANLPKAIY